MEFYETAKKLDLRTSICPQTFSKTKLALAQINSGDILQVRVNPGEHMENVPCLTLREGHQIIDIIKDGGSYVLYIMKQ